MSRRSDGVRVAILAAVTMTLAGAAAAQTSKPPNIVIIWGDDIGQSDVSAYSMGLMGFKTPNIDRVAKEGVMFTDIYAEQSCTAGRSSFLTGQFGKNHLATGTNSCPPCTASTSSTATSTT